MGNKNGNVRLRETDIEDLSRTSGMSPNKVKTMFDDFIRLYPNGKISKEHFKKFMSLTLPNLKDDMEKLGNHIFRVYDSNNDGHIDFLEFMVVYHAMTQGSIQDILGKLFRLFDENGDGFLSVEEIRHLVKDLYQPILIDEGDTKIVTPNEIVFGLGVEMDKNADGKISQQEFITACLHKNTFFSKIVSFRTNDIFKDIYMGKNNHLIQLIEERNSADLTDTRLDDGLDNSSDKGLRRKMSLPPFGLMKQPYKPALQLLSGHQNASGDSSYLLISGEKLSDT